MALLSGVLSVGTVATVLPATCVMPFRLEIKNNDNTDAIYIGGPGVTVRFEPVRARKVRFHVTDSTGGPTLWDFEIYHLP